MKDSNKQTGLEIRSTSEVRAIGDDGTFEGYIAVWDTVDSYTSSFMKGAFSKTIQERGNRVKVFFDHDVLVGKSLEVKEDDHGVYVRGQLSLGVQKAKEVYEFLKDGTLEGLSFGFRTIKERFVDGIRQIHEVKLYEYGPVTFPANDAALITGVRAERIIDMVEKKADELDVVAEADNTKTKVIAEDEARATDFNETLTDAELQGKGYKLMAALDMTLEDIWWSDTEASEKVGMADEALSAFTANYLEWMTTVLERYSMRSAPVKNELAGAFKQHMLDESLTEDDIASSTSLTKEEVRTLMQGNIIAKREKLSELPESIRQAHQQVRVTAVETLCSDLRAGLSPAEKKRIHALLKPVEDKPQQSEPDLSAVMRELQNFRKQFGATENV